MITAKEMAKEGAYFTLIDNEIISLKDLLERERGKEVSDNVAMNYLLRYRKQPSRRLQAIEFIRNIKKYAKITC